MKSPERLISRFRRQIIRQGVLKQVRRNIRFKRKLNKRSQKLKAIRREKARALAAKDNL